jgi:hypothetical protein
MNHIHNYIHALCLSRSRGESCADHCHEATADSGRAGTSTTTGSADGSGSGRERDDGDVDDTGVEGRTGDSFSIRDIVDVDYDYDTRYCCSRLSRLAPSLRLLTSVLTTTCPRPLRTTFRQWGLGRGRRALRR